MSKALCIALIFGGLYGCATSPAPDSTPCHDCVSLRVLDSDLQPTGESIGPSRIAVCGEPISWEDVTVLEVQHDDSLNETVAEELGATAEFVDQWLGVTVSPNYIRKTRQTLAQRGCNLLILGDTRSDWYRHSAPDAVSGTSEYRAIRWGMY